METQKLNLVKKLKGMMMEKIEKKHVKKLKPQSTTTGVLNVVNGGHPCPPIGGDI